MYKTVHYANFIKLSPFDEALKKVIYMQVIRSLFEFPELRLVKGLQMNGKITE